MKIQSYFFKSFALSLILLLTVSSSTAQVQVDDQIAGAYGGKISTIRIEQDSNVEFSGSTYNFDDDTIFFINSMNITFLELLGQSTSRDAKIYNLTKSYESSFRLGPGETYSDSYRTKVDLNAGKYNVSISFVLSNGTATSSASYIPKYALSNQTVQIVGVSESQKVLRAFGYTILAIVGLVILFYFYSKFVKK